jgi:putative DNA primase/helicase
MPTSAPSWSRPSGGSSMSDNIFRTNAPAYWAQNLPVLPLEPRAKAVKIGGWTTFCTQMPSVEQQKAWLKTYPDGNMGLPLGPQSGLVAIDIDTDDEKVHALIEQLLPKSPWKRRGKKGCVYVFKYTGQRTFRIRDVTGATILECLSQGAQIVLPPSIHPDTQRPYEANTELLSVFKSAPELPKDAETILRAALVEAGFDLSTQGFAKITAWVPSGSRDNAMTAHAGILSRAVVRGERTLKEAMDEMVNWVESYTEKVAGDPLDPQKAQEKVVQFFIRDCTGPKRSPVHPGWDSDLDPKLAKEIKEQLGEDGEAWEYDRFRMDATAAFERHPPNSSGFIAELNRILMKVVNCSSMTPLEEGMFLRYVANCSGKTITSAALNKQVQEMRAGNLAGVDHTEIAQALVAELERYGAVRYHNHVWWQWVGACWKELEEKDIMRKIAETFGSYPAAKRHTDHKGIMQTAQALVSGDICTVPVKGINFANGFLTTDLQLKNHRPEYGKAYVLPYRYVPEAAGQMARFMQFLVDCWGEEADFEDRVQSLREAIAATLFGVATRFQKAFCLFGVAGSGKSVTKDIVVGLMPPESTCSVLPAVWGDKFSPAGMVGKLMNIAGELSEDKMIPGDLFKLVVEGAAIEGQYKNKPIFTFEPECAQWFLSNHPPRSRDSSGGFIRRWQFFVFNKPVKPEFKNTNLATEILAEEREAIAAWAVASLPDLMRRHDYIQPPSHLAMVKDVATTNNSVRFFLQGGGRLKIEEARTGKERVATSETTLYEAYWAFCNTTAYTKPVTMKNFRHRMSEMQGEFGFELRLVTNDWGQEEAHYVGITVAGLGKAA